jgi:hypothetical protein
MRGGVGKRAYDSGTWQGGTMRSTFGGRTHPGPLVALLALAAWPAPATAATTPQAQVLNGTIAQQGVSGGTILVWVAIGIGGLVVLVLIMRRRSP